MPGLGSEIRDSAHALAMGKVVLSLLEPAALARYVARGLKRSRRRRSPRAAALAAELERVRGDGFAVDREEFDEDFCCIAAPIFDRRGRFVAALGLSTTPHVFDSEREPLAATVIDVARGAGACRGPPAAVRASGRWPVHELQADAEKPSFLPQPEADLASATRAAQRRRPVAVTREPDERSGG